MRKVKAQGNKSTEVRLIQIFQKNGITGWRRNYHVKGHPDFVFLNRKIAIFVDGCFWHGHEGCKYFVWPKNNPEYWKEKIGGNIVRDKKNHRLLEEQGWRVINIWECQLKKNIVGKTLEDLVLQIRA